ncbi:MAG: MDR family MFS transporter [Desulfotomaculales bacterium]
MMEKISGTKKRLLLTALVITMLTSAINQTVVATAMPHIVAELGGLDLYSWLATAFILASTVAVPLVGKFSDLWGRRPFFLAGIALFLLGSWASGMAHTMNWLIGARVVQGFGGGMLMAMNTITVGDLFPPAQRGRWQGIMMSLFALATLFGPTLGGWITDHLSWRWVFYVSAPFGLVALGLLAYTLPPYRNPEKPRLNYGSPLLLTIALLGLLLALTFAQQDLSWTSGRVLAGFGVAVAGGVLFALVDRRSAEPLLPAWLWKNNIFVISTLILFLVTLGMFAVTLYLPMYLQVVTGVSATHSGALLTPMMLSLMLAAIVSGQLISRLRHYKGFTILGLAVATVGMYYLGRLPVSASHAMVVTGMIVTGTGMGLAMPTFMVAVQNTVQRTELGVISSAIQLFRSIGGVFGSALVGNLVISGLRNRLLPFFPPGAAAQIDPGQILASLLQAPADPRVIIFKNAFSQSITHGFLVGAVLLTAGLAASFLLPDRELKTRWEDEPALSSPEKLPEPGAR